MEQLRESHVLIFGLGGVGGYALEMLARTGVGRFILVEMDTVHPTNINRQLIALHSTVGQSKLDLWQARIRDINPDVEIEAIHRFTRDELTVQILDDFTSKQRGSHFVIDAIDTLSPKVHLIKELVERDLPFVSVMGTGAKLDPRQMRIERMDRVRNCPLARFVRKRLRKLDIPLTFDVVYSEELTHDEAVKIEEGQNKKTVTGTIAYNPAVAGCYAAYVATHHLLNPSERLTK